MDLTKSLNAPHSIPEDLPPHPTLTYRRKDEGFEPDQALTADGVGEGALWQPSSSFLSYATDDSRQPIRCHLPLYLANLNSSAPPLILHGRLGLGGQGEVWEATQNSLMRPVAIKRVRSDILKRAAQTQKEQAYIIAFRQEALTAAYLEHPNIIPVHDLGEDEQGHPLLVMKLVRGHPWSKLIQEDRRKRAPDYYVRHLPILIAVANAVAFAHSRGILHRDLKPSQVMLGEFGEVLLTDWGLACHFSSHAPVESPATVSIPPAIVMGLDKIATNPAGTPAFMAPEQTQDTLDNLGPWTDIFLLGGMLYFILTGTPPYDENDSATAFRKAALGEVEPPHLRVVDGVDIPKELANLAIRAMVPNPRERMATVEEFIQAIQDYLSGATRQRESASLTQSLSGQFSSRAEWDYSELSDGLAVLGRAESLWPENPQIQPLRETLLGILARRALKEEDLTLARVEAQRMSPSPERTALLEEIEAACLGKERNARQRRIAFFTVIGLALLLLAGGFQYVRDQQAARHKAQKAQEETLRQKQEAEYQKDMAERASLEARQAAHEAIHQRSLAETEQYFSGIGFADTYLRTGRPDKALSTLLDHVPAHLRQWEWGNLLASIHCDEMILYLGDLTHTVFHSDYSPDGSRIATSHGDGSVILWDAHTGRRLKQWVPDSSRKWMVRFSHDGTRMLVTSMRGMGWILSLDANTTVSLTGVEGVKQPVMRGGDFSPDGKWVVTTGTDKKVRVWDAETGKQRYEVLLDEVTYDAHYSPDGSRIAVAMLRGKQAVVLDSADGKVLRELSGHGENYSVLSVQFSPDGNKILTSCGDQSARIYDAHTGQLLLTVTHADASVSAAAFNPQGNLFATAGLNGTCQVWDAQTGEKKALIHAAPKMNKISFHPTQNLLLTTAFEEVKIWDIDKILSKGTVLNPLDIPATATLEHLRVTCFPFDLSTLWRDHDNFWLADEGRRYLRSQSGRYVRVDSHHYHYSPDQTQFVRISYPAGPADVVRTDAPSEARRIFSGNTFHARFSHRGEYFAVADTSGFLRLYHSATWECVASVEETQHQVLWSLAFSPDDSLVALGWQSGKIAVWDIQSKTTLWDNPKAHVENKPVTSLEFSPDGKSLLSASSDRTGKLWDTRTGQLIYTLAGHTDFLTAATFSPDGRRILTAAYDHKAKLWDAEHGREIMTVLTVPSDQTLMGLGFSRDGRSVFFATHNGCLYEAGAMPWKDADYPGTPADSFLVRLEMWKRSNRIHQPVSIEDIGWNQP